MENEYKNIVALLKIIDEDGNIKKLKHFGLSYRKIVDLIESAIKSGYLNGDSDIIKLTKIGVTYLSDNKHILKERDKSKWITANQKNKIKKIEIDDIFLPSQNELSFLK